MWASVRTLLMMSSLFVQKSQGSSSEKSSYLNPLDISRFIPGGALHLDRATAYFKAYHTFQGNSRISIVISPDRHVDQRDETFWTHQHSPWAGKIWPRPFGLYSVCYDWRSFSLVFWNNYTYGNQRLRIKSLFYEPQYFFAISLFIFSFLPFWENNSKSAAARCILDVQFKLTLNRMFHYH